MLLFDRNTNPGVIAVIVGVMGIGIGFTFQPTLVAFLAHCNKAQRAVVISDRNFFRCLGGACGLAVSAALLQATLRSNLPTGYEHLSNSTYSLPSKSSVSDDDWSAILDAYAKASRSVFTLQVPLIGICFLVCVFVRDRGLEGPDEPKEDKEKTQPGTNDTEAQTAVKDKPENAPDVETDHKNREVVSAEPRQSTPSGQNDMSREKPGGEGNE